MTVFMLGYIRVFSFVSLLFTIGAAYGVGVYYKQLASQDLRTLTQNNALILTDGYSSSIWKHYGDILLRLNTVEIDTWRRYGEYRRFIQDTAQYFNHLTLDNVIIYRTDGHQIFHQHHLAQDGEEGEKIHLAHPPFDAAVRGEVTSEIIEQATLQKADTTEGAHTLIRTYLPIRVMEGHPLLATDASAKADAVMRIDMNVTREWNQLIHHKQVAVYCIISIFLLLLGCLLFFSRRAESIIAKQHEVNLELTAAAAAAESENRDKSMFLANISHELRTPLNAIIGFSEILGNELGRILEQQHKDYIHDIHNSGKHLLSLINDILEFSKAEAGKLDIDISEIDGSKMVKNSVRLMIPRAEEGQITLIEDLPSKPFIMTTDAKKLKQVLLNLLSNSVKFTPPNGQVKISAWQDAVRERVIFIVSDTGIGIAPKDISKVMAPFGQVESNLSRRYEGTGLGLPLSKRLIELMGGTFSIESEVGVGTTISLDMPLHLAQEHVKG
ncbi:MAG: sensor histidine kinase [Sphaerospermopsis sp. SIO1G2]|nr:sensor histidine kinase [Sphaerospermopsis sp. SIO1G2]